MKNIHIQLGIISVLFTVAFSASAEQNKYFPCEIGSVYHYYSNNTPLFSDSIMKMEPQNIISVGFSNEAYIDTVCLRQRKSKSQIATLSLGDFLDKNYNPGPIIGFGIVTNDTLRDYTISTYPDRPEIDTSNYVRFDNFNPINRDSYNWQAHTKADTSSVDDIFLSTPNSVYTSKTSMVPTLGVVSIDYTPQPFWDLLSPVNKLPSGNSLDFNPLHQDLTLRYITRGKDTLYNSETGVYTPVLSTPWSQIQGPYLQIPNPFSSAKPIQADFIDSKGSIIPASIHLDQGYLHILKPATSLQPQWIRISQGKDWRIFRFKNSIQ